MKFVCPKCDLEGNIEDSNLPETGIWATCPKCKDKFHIIKDSPLKFVFTVDPPPSTPDEVMQGSENVKPFKLADDVSNSSMKIAIVVLAVVVPVVIWLIASGVMHNSASNNSSIETTSPRYDTNYEINIRQERIENIDKAITELLSNSYSSQATQMNSNNDSKFDRVDRELQEGVNQFLKANKESEIYKLKAEREIIMEQLKVLYQQLSNKR